MESSSDRGQELSKINGSSVRMEELYLFAISSLSGNIAVIRG